MRPPLTRFLSRLRHQAARTGGDSDAALLGRFAGLRDQDAFAALVARHGPMVFNVCRRVLGDAHDAEDAFQATFLVLARKAGALRRPGRLPGWLYGVAHRVALRARRSTARRPILAAPAEASEPLDPGPDPLAALTARDLLRALEEEVRALPRAYRLPVVLCCLEGLSQEEAARRLEWTAGSVKGRLERGRAWLRARLERRGLTLPAALAVAEASRGAARTGVPPALVAATTRAGAVFAADPGSAPGGVSPEAVALANRGLRAMSWSKLQAAVVLVAVAGAGATGIGWRGADTAGPARAAQAGAPPPAARDDEPGGGPAEALKKARQELDLIVRRNDEQERLLMVPVVRARERLIELEERLRLLRDEPLPGRGPDSEDAKLTAEEARLRAAVDEINKATSNVNAGRDARRGIEEHLGRVQKGLAAAAERRSNARAQKTQRVIELRQQILLLEEEIDRLERKRSSEREDADRQREAAAARIRELEATGSAPGAEDRSQRAALRKLDAVQRELIELRREVRRLREERKE